MTRDKLLPLLGYDPQLAARLTVTQQTRLRSVAAGWLCALFLVSWPLGYVFWLTEHSAWLATLAPAGVYLLCLNLLRVAAAGGGVSADYSPERVATWRPGVVPSVFLLALAGLMAQPAHLLFTYHDHLPAVNEYRTALAEQHRSVAAGLAASGDHFGPTLAECHFVVHRLQLLWKEPTRAAQFTALYGLLVWVPIYWSRYVALSALRAYEGLRYAERQRRRAQADVELALGLRARLSRWPSYVDGGNAALAGQTERVRHSLTEPRRARRTQLILRWRSGS